MKSFWNLLHKIGDILHLPDLPVWLVILLSTVIILRVPSFFEPYYYGDEMVYLTLGQGVHQGITLYKDIHDNKPPLLYLTAAVAGNLFWFKVILAFWSFITIILFWKLSEEIFKGKKVPQIVSTLIFALATTLPTFEGNIVNAELFMIGPTILAFLILLKNGLNLKKIFLAGVLFSVATLFKVPAAFEMPVILVFWFLTKKYSWKELFINSSTLVIGFLIPIIISAIYFFFKGALNQYLTAAFLQNLGYLSSYQFGKSQEPFLVRNAALLVRAGITAGSVLVLFIFRKKLSPKFILLTTWVLFALFAITLSGRPYPHYFIQTIPALSLMLGVFFAEKSFEQSLVVLPLALAFFVPFYYKYYDYSIPSYYFRFINFASHQVNKDTYFNEFDKNTTRNYELAQFLSQSSTESDRVFMWDPDSPTVYALARRLPPIKYVVPYHVYDFSSVDTIVNEVATNKPKFIILTAGNPLPQIIPVISKNYLLISQIGNASVWSRINLERAK